MTALSPQELEGALNDLFRPQSFDDPGLNGLQVDAARPIRVVATAVSVSAAAVSAAAERGAQALVVHHGLFWGGQPAPLTGVLGGRVRALLGAGVSLLAYHLPVDAHEVVGNAHPVLRSLGTTATEPFGDWRGTAVGARGELAAPVPPGEFARLLEAEYDHPALHFPGRAETVRRVALVTGAGSDFLDEAAAAGCDALVTGEPRERSQDWAAETGVHLFCCGHWATETAGMRLLARWIDDNLGLQAEYVSLPNPV